MSEKTVRKLFIFILLFLPLQYILVGIIGYYKTEPWPAFVFPGFKSVYQQEGNYLIRQTFFELYNNENEKISTLQPYQLFEELPRSQIAGFTRVLFHDKTKLNQLSSEAKELIYQQGREAVGRDFNRLEIVREIQFLESKNRDMIPDSTARFNISQIHFSN